MSIIHYLVRLFASVASSKFGAPVCECSELQAAPNKNRAVGSFFIWCSIVKEVATILKEDLLSNNCQNSLLFRH